MGKRLDTAKDAAEVTGMWLLIAWFVGIGAAIVGSVIQDWREERKESDKVRR